MKQFQSHHKQPQANLTCDSENERLPTELGWTKQANVIQLADVSRMAQVISNATSLFTTSKPVVVDRRDLHSGFSF
jgi:hypothetical protein